MLPTSPSKRLFSFSLALLTVTVWTSTLIFGLYILLFYFVAYFGGNVAQWNEVLPGLYDENNAASTAGIGLHFLSGGLILVMGCLQMLGWVRQNYPAVHRVSGRIYILASLFAAVGGLTFIFLRGTIGGPVMDVGFIGYGLLMGAAAVETIRHARAGRMDRHRAWGIRLFALAIGSWLYRIDYGLYIGFGGQGGHTADFTGWFDYFMDFWFYVPNLLIAEIIIRREDLMKKTAYRSFGALVLGMTSLMLLLATYFFIRELWGPGIMSAFKG